MGHVCSEGARDALRPSEVSVRKLVVGAIPSHVGCKNRSKAGRIRNNGSGLLTLIMGGRKCDLVRELDTALRAANQTARFATSSPLTQQSLFYLALLGGACDCVAELIVPSVLPVHCYPARFARGAQCIVILALLGGATSSQRLDCVVVASPLRRGHLRWRTPRRLRRPVPCSDPLSNHMNRRNYPGGYTGSANQMMLATYVVRLQSLSVANSRPLLGPHLQWVIG